MADGVSVHVPTTGVDDGEVTLVDDQGNEVSVDLRNGEYSAEVHDSETHDTLIDLLTVATECRDLLLRILED